MFRDLLQEAYAAMRHNRRRTALTMLGMAWGIATVVMLLAYGDGFGQAAPTYLPISAPSWSLSFRTALLCRPVARKQESLSGLR